MHGKPATSRDRALMANEGDKCSAYSVSTSLVCNSEVPVLLNCRQFNQNQVIFTSSPQNKSYKTDSDCKSDFIKSAKTKKKEKRT